MEKELLGKDLEPELRLETELRDDAVWGDKGMLAPAWTRGP